MKLICIKSVMEPKNYCSVRSIMKKNKYIFGLPTEIILYGGY